MQLQIKSALNEFFLERLACYVFFRIEDVNQAIHTKTGMLQKSFENKYFVLKRDMLYILCING